MNFFFFLITCLCNYKFRVREQSPNGREIITLFRISISSRWRRRRSELASALSFLSWTRFDLDRAPPFLSLSGEDFFEFFCNIGNKFVTVSRSTNGNCSTNGNIIMTGMHLNSVDFETVRFHCVHKSTLSLGVHWSLEYWMLFWQCTENSCGNRFWNGKLSIYKYTQINNGNLQKWLKDICVGLNYL